MLHRISQKKLNRTSTHRKALLANLAISLIEHGRINTTLPKAKTLRPYIEKLITKARSNNLASRRYIASKLLNHSAASKKLVEEVAKKYQERPGGYTRILKSGFRYGDAAPMAIIELV
mgnify:CR=1 FL=1|jgi:large subunit ribosomal protein L17